MGGWAERLLTSISRGGVALRNLFNAYFAPRVLLRTGDGDENVLGPFETPLGPTRRPRLLSSHRSPSPQKLEPHKPSFWFLGYTNCFHALAPSHVLCPLSGNFSPPWLAASYSSIRCQFNDPRSKKASPSVHSSFSPSSPGCMVASHLVSLLALFPAYNYVLFVLWSPPNPHLTGSSPRVSCSLLQV